MPCQVRSLAALFLLAGLAACGGGDPLPAGGPDGGPSASPGADATPTPGATPTPIPAPTPTPTPAPPPADRFGGLPVYPGSRVVALDMSRFTATYRTGAALATVAAYYDRTLPEEGWEIDERDERRSEIEYEVQRGDDDAEVRLRREGGETEIRLRVNRD